MSALDAALVAVTVGAIVFALLVCRGAAVVRRRARVVVETAAPVFSSGLEGQIRGAELRRLTLAVHELDRLTR